MNRPSSYRLGGLGLLLGLALVAGLSAWLRPAEAAAPPRQDEPDPFAGARGWINSKPLRLADLKGKIVLLDFWTYCCINCHHVLPDLAKLEEKYKNELVVIGVHTAKFEAEKSTANIRQKVREYRIKHPVINDADQEIWNTFRIESWPTLFLIDAAGTPVGRASGEGNYDVLDRAIAALIAKQKNLIDTRPLVFFPESETKDDPGLLFPGKVLADPEGKRLFIADTGHNRIVVTGPTGSFQEAIGNGAEGLADGGFDQAKFNRPQGLLLFEGKLYVADTENHAIREVDLETKTVATVAGTGKQSQERRAHGPARKTGLNSPWDLAPFPEGRALAVAMAGLHQIWRLDLEHGTVGHYAGSSLEDIADGGLASAAFAQPSGLATDGKHLFVADSEGSCVRSINFATKKVATLAGVHDLPGNRDLFTFGDRDGQGASVLLQHCLGVAFGDGRVFIADTYNNKVKALDPTHKEVRTLAGSGRAGDSDSRPEFYQPGGLSLSGQTLYVADTNNHLIRTVDTKTGAVATLDTSSVKPPTPPRRPPSFANAKHFRPGEARVAPSQQFTLDVALPLPKGFKLNPEAPTPIRYLLEAPGQDGILAESVSPAGEAIEDAKPDFQVSVPLAKEPADGDAITLRLSVSAFVCKSGNNAYCTFQNYVWDVPVKFAVGAGGSVALKNE